MLRRLILAAAFAGALSAQAREVIDATQTHVRLVDHPARIVTLAPSLGELASDFCGADIGRIAGVSEYTDYPPALAHIASIGPYARFNLEKVMALKPDLVLATLDGNPKDQVLHLRELGLPVVVVATATLNDVSTSMRLVGQAMGQAERGESMAAQLERGLAHLRASRSVGARPRVLLQLGDDPLVVVGKGAFLNDALEAVGATNVYGDTAAHYPRPALEDVVHRDPDVIIVLTLGHDAASFEAMARKWRRFSSMKAVRADRVRVLKDDAVLRPTLRLLEGLSKLRDGVGK